MHPFDPPLEHLGLAPRHDLNNAALPEALPLHSQHECRVDQE